MSNPFFQFMSRVVARMRSAGREKPQAAGDSSLRPPPAKQDNQMHSLYQRRLGLAGLATMNGSQRKGQNSVVRSGRQRRKAFEKEQDALIEAAWKRWGDVENMPPEERAKLHRQIDRLHREYCGRQ